MMSAENKIKAEYTDTYAGEANYSWCRVANIEPASKLAIVRRVKAEFGLSGIRCRRYDHGDQIWLYPSGMCRVVFIYLY